MLEPPPGKRQAFSDPCSEDLVMDSFDDTSIADICVDEDDDIADDDITLFGQDFVLEGMPITPEEVDSLLAQELTQLSMDEREKALFDLHGVSSGLQETPKMIQDALILLGKALDSIPGTQAYQKALVLNPAYVRDQEFLLKFLRAERFDISAAAVRLAKFFEFKMDLFGEDLLAKDITQDDLDQEDLEVLYIGRGYALPFRDLAGRLIIFMLPQPLHVSVRAVLRIVLYVSMVHSEDEETQRKGQIHISYLMGQEVKSHQVPQRQELNEGWAKLVTGIPMRIEAIHLCANSSQWRPIFAKFKSSATLWTRARIREHIGDAETVNISLQTFGVPTQSFPLLANEETLAQLSSHRWKKRRILEQMKKKVMDQKRSRKTTNAKAAQAVRVGTPGQNDVLLGRGRAFYSYVGNLRLKSLVIERSKVYETAGHSEKQRVSADIVKLIQSQSGRFLRDDGAGWAEVDDETATNKVSHVFRTLRALKKSPKAPPKSHSVKRHIN